MHIEKHIIDNKFPRRSSSCFTSLCFTSPCFTSPCFTSPCFTSPCFTSPCFTSPCFTKSMFYKSMFYKSSPCFTSPVHGLQVQSNPRSSPCFTTCQTKFRPYSLYCFSKYKIFKQKFKCFKYCFLKTELFVL